MHSNMIINIRVYNKEDVRAVNVVVGNEHGDLSLNLELICFYLILLLYTWTCLNLTIISLCYGQIVEQACLFNLCMATSLGEGEVWI